MAEIEQTEHGDEGRVREWLARAMRAAGDPAWTADGVVSDRWMPVSPHGRLDGYQWKVPLAEIGVSRPVIEALEAPRAQPVPEPPPEASVAPAEPEPEAKPAPVPEEPERASAKPAEPAARAKPVQPVIPLVHVPDDPGPDSALEAEPLPEPSPPHGWQRIKQLFR